MKERMWPQDYNRPLSMEEMSVAQRLDVEPEPNYELGALVQERAGGVQASRTKRVSESRRNKDAPCSAEGTEIRKRGRFGAGLG